MLKRVVADSTKITFKKMLEEIGNSIDNITTLDKEDDEDEEEDGEENENRELSDDNEPDWVV